MASESSLTILSYHEIAEHEHARLGGLQRQMHRLRVAQLADDLGTALRTFQSRPQEQATRGERCHDQHDVVGEKVEHEVGVREKPPIIKFRR